MNWKRLDNKIVYKDSFGLAVSNTSFVSNTARFAITNEVLILFSLSQYVVQKPSQITV